MSTVTRASDIYGKSVQQYVKRTRLLVAYRLQSIRHKEVSYEIEVTPCVLNSAAPVVYVLVAGGYVLQDNWIMTIAVFHPCMQKVLTFFCVSFVERAIWSRGLFGFAFIEP